jgi:hypothetical protein
MSDAGDDAIRPPMTRHQGTIVFPALLDEEVPVLVLLGSGRPLR